MKGEKIEIVYQLNKLSAKDVWDCIFTFLKEENISIETEVEFIDKTRKLKEVAECISSEGRSHFGVMFEGISIQYSQIPSWRHELILVENNSESIHFKWEQLVKLFFRKALFIQAWVTDIDYDYWQNATDPLQFKSSGKSFEELPLKSNGLPYPLEQMIIDTSKNPGRRLLRDGYVEAVGSQMWFTRKFEQETGIDLNIEISGCSVENQNGLIHVHCGDKLFVDNSTKNKQILLRQSIFP